MTTPTFEPMLYLIRHASPDWSRTDIRYDIPPGPPLTAQGRTEAGDLGQFLKNAGIRKLYHSPLERSADTARIAAAIAGVEVIEAAGLAEWRRDEHTDDVHTRLWPLAQACLEESRALGPIGLVTHGAPVAHMLEQFGMERTVLERHRHMFDHSNPLPPGGAWLVRPAANGAAGWDLQLVFTPGLSI